MAQCRHASLLVILVLLTLARPLTGYAGNDRVLLITEQTTVSASITIPRTPGQDAALCIQIRDQAARAVGRYLQDRSISRSTNAGEFPLHYTCQSTPDHTHLDFIMTVILPHPSTPPDSLRTVLDGPIR